ncbi:hypothetical protein [Streptosporangium pseudovulgare]|uniref:Uncharacterized protein n=1 Tax=Streptosporangium pseudovulgare TaxID=35765 RepID=A0ABQ2RBK8_9ACTN|nr:hypothetical protein [Streptosporangium pseudovulgare]GGQ23617.1 hypothetical protein GCM10010140_62370 [Streptosporangium pseudovulgare]
MSPDEVKRWHALARRKSADPERIDQLYKAAVKECGGTVEKLAEAITRELAIEEGLAKLMAEIRRT